MLKKLAEYKQLNERVANAALNTFRRYLWYISEITVVLALFDDDVSAETKVLMVAENSNNRKFIFIIAILEPIIEKSIFKN